MYCNECEAGGLAEPGCCERCGRPVSSATLTPDALNAARETHPGAATAGVHTETQSCPPCECCGGPTTYGRSFCSACDHPSPSAVERFDDPEPDWATELESPAPPRETPAPALRAVPEIFATSNVADTPAANAPLDSGLVERFGAPAIEVAAAPEDAYVVERFGAPAIEVTRTPEEAVVVERFGAPPIEVAPASEPAEDGEPAPWWENRARAAAESTPVVRDAPAAATPAPVPVFAAPPPPTFAAPPARAAEGAQAAARPRAVPRPPVPGATTRPAQPPSRRGPVIVLGVSLVVVMAAGVPLAKRWLRSMPTVTVSDPSELAAQSRAQERPVTPTGAAAPPSLARVAASSAPKPAVRPTGAHAAAVPGRTPAARGNRATSARPAAAAPTTAPEPVPPPAVVEQAPEPAPEPPPPPVAAEPVATGPVFEMGQVDVKPQVASQVPPQLPADVDGRDLTDLVILRVLVTASGRAADVNVLRRSRSGASLDGAVVAAVRRWSFSPARRRGQTVSCWYNVGVPFRPQGRPLP